MTVPFLPFESNLAPEKFCPICNLFKPHADYYRSVSKKDGLSTYCKSCDSVRRKANYQANHERELDGAKRRREEHPERVAHYNKKRRSDPVKRAENLERARQHYQKNAARLREYRRKYYQEHKPEIAVYLTEYRRKHLSRILAYNAVYSYRTKHAGGKFTKGEFTDMCKFFEDKCLCCGKVVKLEADHVIPIVQGGTNDISNIQPLCRSCNASKSDKAIDYRLQWHPWREEAGS